MAAIFAAYGAEGLDAELIIVDDNSPDGTGALADELATRHRIRVIHRAGKLGLGTAVIEGFTASAAPIVGVIDADMSHPPEPPAAHAGGDAARERRRRRRRAGTSPVAALAAGRSGG